MAALMNSDDENDGENEFDNEVCRRRYFSDKTPYNESLDYAPLDYAPLRLTRE